MAVTSGTSAFNLDILDIIEEAYERCGIELEGGYDLTTARRSLQLLALEWVNKGLLQFTVTETSQALTAGTSNYSLGSGVIDIVQAVVRKGTGTDQVDYPLNRISLSVYSSRTQKNTQGRPIDYYVDRQTDGVDVTLWPVPDSADWTLIYWYMRRIEDIGDNTNNFDVPEKFLPALIAGLAFHIAKKKPEAIARIPHLKADYMEALEDAKQEDRMKASFFFTPHVRRIR